ncbi:MAG: hypothetical protein V1494_01505 [Candidatus Diapherotrites archaeon]
MGAAGPPRRGKNFRPPSIRLPESSIPSDLLEARQIIEKTAGKLTPKQIQMLVRQKLGFRLRISQINTALKRMNSQRNPAGVKPRRASPKDKEVRSEEWYDKWRGDKILGQINRRMFALDALRGVSGFKSISGFYGWLDRLFDEGWITSEAYDYYTARRLKK